MELSLALILRLKGESISQSLVDEKKLCHIVDPPRGKREGHTGVKRCMKDGPSVQGTLLEEVDLQLDLEGFKKEEVVSGEEVETFLVFEAQKKRLFSLPFLARSADKKQPPQSKTHFLLRRC